MTVVLFLKICNFFPRHTLAELDLLSCTDLAQRWGTSSRRGLYAPEPLQRQCHFRELLADSAVEKVSDSQAVLRQLITAAPESGLALHLRGREDVGEVNADEALCCLRKHETQGFVVASMHLAMPPPSGIDDDDFYQSHVNMSPVNSAKLCQETQSQTGHKWANARRVRITASEAHQWYTYVGDAWKDKVERHFTSRFSGSVATRYGQEHEKAAIAAYEKQQGEHVMGCGLVVPPGAPWLGCSPDGVVCDESGVPVKLLEVKCPMVGKEQGIQALASHPPAFLTADGENLKLKRKNRYFSQVQLSMAILNIRVCDLAVYSKLDNKVLVVRVPRDDAYQKSLLGKLHKVYFEHLLPHLRAEFSH